MLPAGLLSLVLAIAAPDVASVAPRRDGGARSPERPGRGAPGVAGRGDRGGGLRRARIRRVLLWRACGGRPLRAIARALPGPLEPGLERARLPRVAAFARPR